MPEQPNYAVRDVARAVQQLWPRADGVDMTGRDKLPASFARGFVVVPSLEQPKAVVPLESSRAAAHAIRRFSDALGPRDRVTRLAGGAAARLGAHRLLQGRLVLTGSHVDEDSILSYLTCALGRPVILSLGVGTGRANQKPVVQVFDSAGNPLAFVKIGNRPSTRGLVDGEARSLEVLSRANLRTIDVPRLLHHGRWHGHSVLVMSIVPTSALGRGRRSAVPMESMLEFARSLGVTRTEFGDAPFWHQLRREVDGSRGSGVRSDRLSGALDQAERKYSRSVVTLGAFHGDWTPWNMASVGKRVSLWDLEQFRTDVPVGLDVIHYAVNMATSGRGVDDRSLSRALDRRGNSGTGRPSGDPVVITYLALLAWRYLSNALVRRQEGDERDILGASIDALLTVLEQRVGSKGQA